MLADVHGSLLLMVHDDLYVVPAERLRFTFIESQRLEEGVQSYYVARLDLPKVEVANACMFEYPPGRFSHLELDAPIEVQLKENRLSFTFSS